MREEREEGGRWMDEFDVPLPCQFSITDEEEEAATAGNAVKKSKERESGCTGW